MEAKGSDGSRINDCHLFCVCLYLPGLDFLRTFDGELEVDIIYSDDDYNDQDDDHFYANNAAYKPLEPHPRIKQLTNEVLHFCFSSLKVKPSSLYYLSLVCRMIQLCDSLPRRLINTQRN